MDDLFDDKRRPTSSDGFRSGPPKPPGTRIGTGGPSGDDHDPHWLSRSEIVKCKIFPVSVEATVSLGPELHFTAKKIAPGGRELGAPVENISGHLVRFPRLHIIAEGSDVSINTGSKHFKFEIRESISRTDDLLLLVNDSGYHEVGVLDSHAVSGIRDAVYTIDNRYFPKI